MSDKLSKSVGGKLNRLGRKKGSVNKTTAAVKDALTKAFDGRGGVRALTAWADENPTEFYKLWAKLLPTEVTGKDGESLMAGVVILPAMKS